MSFLMSLHYPLIIVILVFCTLSPIFSDTVYLKNGSTLNNVKAVPHKSYYYIVYKSGKTRIINGINIKSVIISDVNWGMKITRQQLEKLVEARVREVIQKQRTKEKEISSKNNKYNNKSVTLENEHKKSVFSAAFRSFLIPGWGQMYKNERNKGGLIFFSLILMSSFYVNSSVQYNSAQNDYNRALILAGSSYFHREHIVPISLYAQEMGSEASNRIKKYGDYGNYSFFMMIGIYIYNLVDALLFSNGDNKILYRKLSHGFSINVRDRENINTNQRSRKIVFQYGWRF